MPVRHVRRRVGRRRRAGAARQGPHARRLRRRGRRAARIGLALSPTFVAFTPWTTLDGYRAIARRRSSGSTWWSTSRRCSWRSGCSSRRARACSSSPEIRALVGALRPAALAYPWRHPDPAVDALQRERHARWSAARVGAARRRCSTRCGGCSIAALGRTRSAPRRRAWPAPPCRISPSPGTVERSRRRGRWLFSDLSGCRLAGEVALGLGGGPGARAVAATESQSRAPSRAVVRDDDRLSDAQLRRGGRGARHRAGAGDRSLRSPRRSVARPGHAGALPRRAGVVCGRARRARRQRRLDGVLAVGDRPVALAARSPSARRAVAPGRRRARQPRQAPVPRAAARRRSARAVVRVWCRSAPTLGGVDDVPFPCVVKPLVLSGSRGVIRADDPGGSDGGAGLARPHPAGRPTCGRCATRRPTSS